MWRHHKTKTVYLGKDVRAHQGRLAHELPPVFCRGGSRKPQSPVSFSLLIVKFKPVGGSGKTANSFTEAPRSSLLSLPDAGARSKGLWNTPAVLRVYWFLLVFIPRVTAQGLSVISVVLSTPHSTTSRNSLTRCLLPPRPPILQALVTSQQQSERAPSSLPPFPRSSFSPPFLRASLLLLRSVACHAARACQQRPKEAPATSPKRKRRRLLGQYAYSRLPVLGTIMR
jgi:hypothetical protein